MSIHLIKQKYIPEDIFIPKPENGEWKYFQQFVFKNGLEYYTGTNKLIDDFNTVIENIRFDYTIVKDSNNATELQQIYNTEYKIFINYNESIKIWKYYTKHNKQIESLLKEFL